MTDRIKDGGPAFPTLASNITYSHGMTIRDWFAGQAMNVLMGTVDECDHEAASQDFPAVCHAFARQAYALADAMLSARDVKQ